MSQSSYLFEKKKNTRLILFLIYTCRYCELIKLPQRTAKNLVALFTADESRVTCITGTGPVTAEPV